MPCNGYSLRRIFSASELEITDQNAVMNIVRWELPHILINAAAYTDVDGCEDNRDHAFAVNGYAAGYLANACSNVDAILVHYSTDYIFDGKKDGIS